MPLAVNAAFLVPFALVANSCVGAVADAISKLPAIDFIGKGYNIFRGNPHALDGKLDEGFVSDVLELTYNKETQIGQDAWLIPDGTDGVEIAACDESFKAYEMGGLRSYSESLKLTVDTNFTKFPAAFSASADYKSMKNDMENLKYIKTEASATCSVYGIWVEEFTPPRATENFIQAVRELPIVYDAGIVQNFIRNFGTHLVSGAGFGGVWGEVTSFTRESWYKMATEGNGFDLAGAAALSALVSAGGKLSSEADKTKVERFASFREVENKFFKGGEYSQDTSEWITSVRSRPMPIVYRLVSLDEVVHPRFLKGSGMEPAALEAKRQNVAKGLENHCSQLLAAGEITSCEAPDLDPIPEKLKVVKLAWARNAWPSGEHHEYKCPSGSYITKMTWKDDKWCLVDLTVTCSDDSTILTWTQNLDGKQNAPVTCSGGFGGIQAEKKNSLWYPFNSGVINVKMNCLGEDEGQYSNGKKGYEWKPVQTCPEDTPVLVGLEVLDVGGGYGIYNYRPICSNGNLLRRLQARFLV